MENLNNEMELVDKIFSSLKGQFPKYRKIVDDLYQYFTQTEVDIGKRIFKGSFDVPSTFKKISLDDRCEIIKQLATLEINNDLFFAKDFSVDVLFSYGDWKE